MVKTLIASAQSEAFRSNFLAFLKPVTRLGLFNSLSQTVLRLTAPGISDTYQGSEMWDFSLVDPDNRRAVNYEHRRHALESVKSAPIQSLTANMQDGWIKMFVHHRMSTIRRSSPDLFLQGSYEPIASVGDKARHLFAFGRVLGNKYLLVVIPRFLASLVMTDAWGVEDWGNTRVVLPEHWPPIDLENVFTGGRPLRVDADRSVYAAQIFKDFPVAVLCSAAEN